MLTDNLLRDFNLGPSFQATSAINLTNAPLVLTAHIHKFAWVESDAGSVAELQVEVRLSNMQDEQAVLFRRSYAFKSQPFRENSSDAFATAMSQIVGEFSETLRRDLCSVF
jgi:ABC-type uncharacterized transport system auxiliary subunit